VGGVFRDADTGRSKYRQLERNQSSRAKYPKKKAKEFSPISVQGGGLGVGREGGRIEMKIFAAIPIAKTV